VETSGKNNNRKDRKGETLSVGGGKEGQDLPRYKSERCKKKQVLLTNEEKRGKGCRKKRGEQAIYPSAVKKLLAPRKKTGFPRESWRKRKR